MNTILEAYGREFCVIDASNLFVCTTLADELILFSAEHMLDALTSQCAELGIAVKPTRALRTYSGGEQAMISCLLISLMLPARPVRILLVHIVEALSLGNARKMLCLMRANASQISVYTLTATGPAPYA
ncbi:hypothetical protein MASR1M90_15860 [Desulfovibrionales bacterium]